MFCTEEEKNSLGHGEMGGVGGSPFWWLGRHHNCLTGHNSHNLTSQDDAKDREAAIEK